MPPNVSIALATLCYAVYALLVSRAAGRIDPLLGSSLVNAVGTVLPLIVYAGLKAGGGGGLGSVSAAGAGYSALAGLAIAAFGFFLMKAFEGGGVAYVVPLIYGGTVVLAALGGWLLFREAVPPLQILGICTVVLGLGLIVFARMKGAPSP